MCNELGRKVTDAGDDCRQFCSSSAESWRGWRRESAIRVEGIRRTPTDTEKD